MFYKRFAKASGGGTGNEKKGVFAEMIKWWKKPWRNHANAMALSWQKKKAPCFQRAFLEMKKTEEVLGLGLGLGKTDNALVRLPLTTLLQELHALKALEDVAFRRNGAGTFEAAMLRHDELKTVEKNWLETPRS